MTRLAASRRNAAEPWENGKDMLDRCHGRVVLPGVRLRCRQREQTFACAVRTRRCTATGRARRAANIGF